MVHLMEACLLTALQAYLLGSLLFGVLVSKLFYHDDVRLHGSGNAGMTNVLRTYGKLPAVITTIGDVGKSVVAVKLGQFIFDSLLSGTGADFQPLLQPICGAYLAVRQMVLSKREDSANDLYLRTLELAQVPEEEYFSHVVSDDLNEILRDIREAHKTDSTTADEPSAAAQVQQQLQTAMNFEGSSDEKKARALLATLGIDYDAITKEQFVNLIEVLRLSKHMKNPINRRGKSNMTHGKGKRKRK